MIDRMGFCINDMVITRDDVRVIARSLFWDCYKVLKVGELKVFG